MSDCIFCKIANGEIPSAVMYEDDMVFAFDDIAPQAPVHTLVIPKQHYAGLADNVPGEVIIALMNGVMKVADIKGVAESGYRTIINTGPDAGQTVHHLHVHVMGGRRMAEGMVRFEQGE